IVSLLAEPPTVTLHESEGTYFLMENADYLLDKEKTANLEYAKKEEAKFQPIGKYFTIIIENTGVWIKFKIKNGENKKQEWIAVPSFTFLGEKFILHQACSGKLEVFSAGRSIPESDRRVYRKHSLHSFLISLEPNEECSLYLYTEDRNFNLLNLILQDKESYSNYEYSLSMYLGAFIGIGLMLFFYNLFLLFFTKDKAYFYYILFVFIHITYQTIYYRVVNEYNIIYSESFLNFWISTGFCFVAPSLILFANTLLQINDKYPKVNILFKLIIAINLLAYIPMVIWGFEATTHSTTFLITIFLLPYVGIKEWMRGNRSAKYFTIAWLTYCIFVSAGYLNGLMHVPVSWKYSYLMFYPILFGSALEMTLFSLALGDRYNQIQKRNESQTLQLLKEKLNLEEERHTRRKLEMNLLKTIIQPHFLINSLNSLVGLIWESPKKAADMIVALGAEVRNIQEIPDVKEVTLAKELEFCSAYLKIMSLRLEENYALTTEGLNGDESVPPLLFHTLIENAFTHGKGNYSALKFHLRKELTTNSLLYTFTSTSSEKNSTPSNRVGIGTKYIQTALEEFAPGRWKVNQFYDNGLWVVKVEVKNG
ncbi:MAG TPA: 7TM diverse intracellular signaling domain-containing protein, partial [Leptospiraceae bacterium]|nr:7TM diverse intracellular signaling domain-containing protein [Leptospiraceae bacterium]